MPSKHLEDIAVYASSTQTIIFATKIFRDTDAKEFVARFGGSRLSQQPGIPAMTEIVQDEELRDADYELLLERSKARMTELGGGDCYMHLIHLYPGASRFQIIKRAVQKNE
ncbi:MAG: hypothetical protein WAU45_04055 [Blastocatellia bacterium]